MAFILSAVRTQLCGMMGARANHQLYLKTERILSLSQWCKGFYKVLFE